jgi:fumarate reductase flavoprotein subunit
MPDIRHEHVHFETRADVVIVGGGACGSCAALAAADRGAEVVVLERDAAALGSTAMSTGLIPAAGTPEQSARGILDSPDIFFRDIMAKTKGRTDAALARRLTEESAETIAWLRDRHEVPLALIDGFLYAGHSHLRMYGTPRRTGLELQAALDAAIARTGAAPILEARVDSLYVDDETITGVAVARPDGSRELIGCGALVLACCGYAGNSAMVRRWIPEMAGAVYHGHLGNQGDAIVWAEGLGAALADMAGYQGHGGLAVGHAIPILWPLIMEGGFQVNRLGRRFSNEAEGYSEQAAKVNAQIDHLAWSIFDHRLHELMLGFDDYRDALDAGAIWVADSWAELAAIAGLPTDPLRETAEDVEACVRGERIDPFGRDFTGRPPLRPPFRAAKVTGALFHSQGGLVVDESARVQRAAGGAFPNLFAGGGAARGISGSEPGGYLAGNGLLTATTLGKLAGRTAAPA